MENKNDRKEGIAGYNYEEWEKLERQFHKDYENSTRYNKSFRELITEILDGESDDSFANKTELSHNMLYRLRKQVDEKDPPQRSTLISVCVGYDLDLMMAQALLCSLGLGFNRFNKRDYAYSFLLTRCRGKSIHKCNEILKELEVEERYLLGSRERRTGKK